MPDKVFIPAPTENLPMQRMPFMKMNTLEKAARLHVQV
jgi:hypothetical protein